MHGSSAFQSIINILRKQCAIDFSAYKPGTLSCRINSRLHSAGTSDYVAYRSYLTDHPAEMDLLLDAFSITVSNLPGRTTCFRLVSAPLDSER